MSQRDTSSRQPGTGRGKEGELSHSKEHLSPKRADEQEYPAEVRPTTPIEEAGERKGDESGDGGTERRGP